MIAPEVAAQQVQRLTGLQFFPQAKEPMKELRLAVESALTDAIAIRAVSAWIEQYSECPRPAQMRSMIADLNAQERSRQVRCRICDGNGQVIVWQLVTFHGNSLRRKRTEDTNIQSDEQAREWIKGWIEWKKENPHAEDQDIRSAAKACECRKAMVTG